MVKKVIKIAICQETTLMNYFIKLHIPGVKKEKESHNTDSKTIFPTPFHKFPTRCKSQAFMIIQKTRKVIWFPNTHTRKQKPVSQNILRYI